MDKENALRILGHINYLTQYAIDSLTEESNMSKNINKYHKLLDSIRLHLDIIEGHIEKPGDYLIKAIEYNIK